MVRILTFLKIWWWISVLPSFFAHVCGIILTLRNWFWKMIGGSETVEINAGWIVWLFLKTKKNFFFHYQVHCFCIGVRKGIMTIGTRQGQCQLEPSFFAQRAKVIYFISKHPLGCLLLQTTSQIDTGRNKNHWENLKSRLSRVCLKR